jgi:hypothetical protein
LMESDAAEKDGETTKMKELKLLTEEYDEQC